MDINLKGIFYFTILLGLLSACQQPWNAPYPHQEQQANFYYSSFAQAPKTLDPARSYATDEAVFTGAIYEPPLQYHYLLRPYTLIPLTAQSMPQIYYLDGKGQRVSDSASSSIAYTVYEIKIKPHIYFQPHPAFVHDAKGDLFYLHHSLSHIHQLKDLKLQSTRELTAADYVYEIKRLASPKTQSPIYSVLSNYIVGFDSYGQQLRQIYDQKQKQLGDHFFLDLRNYNFPGVRIIDNYTYQIIVQGKYPQFIYWLAMPFFAPMPWEADALYSGQQLTSKNITLDWYPIGTGPYLLAENNPNRAMILQKNPYFHRELYPQVGMPTDKDKGLLQMSGKPLPFLNTIIFTLEKENIPRWNKFLQGYYDQSLIATDNFDQAIKIDPFGNPILSPLLSAKNLHLETNVSPTLFYVGFNMLDPVIGGLSLQAKQLRQAISIAVDFEEYINIFLNGRGLPAYGPIPPQIFGYADDYNPIVYEPKDGKVVRHSLAYAKQLMAAAGYPEGRDEKTGKQLILRFDVPGGTQADQGEQLDWFRKQFAKLGIELQVEATQYNRFQDKLRTGNVQLFLFGWHADYPDPENFLFLLYGPNGKLKSGGENVTNYQNPQFDKLFQTMKAMPNNQNRQDIIRQLVGIAREDAPWIWGLFPKNFVLAQQWVGPLKPNELANNTLKYIWINPELRYTKRNAWNQPLLWPLWILVIVIPIILIPVYGQYWRLLHRTTRRVK